MRGFISVLDAVLASHAEVLITTRSQSFQHEIPFSTVVVDAHDLQVEADEALSQHANHLCAPRGVRARGVPAVLLDTKRGPDRFVGSLCSKALQDVDEALAVLALVVARGNVNDLLALVAANDEGSLAGVERNYPHAGVTSRSSTFAAMDLLMEQRQELLTFHMDGLVKFSNAETPHNLALSLVKVLVDQGDEAFARLISERYLAEGELTSVLSASRNSSIAKTLPGKVRSHKVSLAGAELAFQEGSVEVESDSSMVDIRLFGTFELYCNGRLTPEVGEVRQKAKILLALLLVNRDKEMPMLWVQRALWPEADVSRSRSSFYNLWSYLRTALKPKDGKAPALHRSRDTVSLKGVQVNSDLIELEEAIENIKTCTDTRECERILSHLIQIYRGPMLPGIENAQLDAYRSMYQNKVLDAMVDGATFLSGKGEAKLAQRFAAFAFETDPSREDVCYLFMSMQKRLGQFAGAISTFMMCRRVLVERFGIDGSRRLDALYEEILNEVS